MGDGGRGIREAAAHDAILVNCAIVVLVDDDALVAATLPHPVMQAQVVLHLEVGAGQPQANHCVFGISFIQIGSVV